MFKGFYAVLGVFAAFIRSFAFGAVMVFALGTATLSLGASFNLWSWPTLALAWGDTPLPNAGMWALLGVTALSIALLFYLPANARMMALELSHRRFELSMRDITRAYHIAHAEDRASAFRLSSEFEAVKERLAFLRRHPDLGSLEPELLDIAAKMSFASRDLAKIYSDERVARARTFLRQRQEEIDNFTARIQDARAVVEDLRGHIQELDLTESQGQRDLARLRADPAQLIPEVFTTDGPPSPSIVTPLRKRSDAIDKSLFGE